MPKPPTYKQQALDIPKTVQQGARFHRQGKLTEAEKLYRAVLGVRPDHFDALHLLGVLRAQQGNAGEAVRLISLALERQPRSADALSSLGSALTQLNRDDEAIASFDRALSINPSHADAHYNRGTVLAKLNRHHEAISSYASTLATRPDHAGALYNYGNALARVNRHVEAITSYDKLLAIQPGNAKVLNNRGTSLLELDRCEEAIASFDEALSAKPDHVDSLNNRGIALARLGRHEQAIESYERALIIKPNHIDALNNRGISLSKLQRDEEAIASYDRALGIKPDYVDALNNRGRALAKLERHEEAIASYERALEINPAYADALFNRGNALANLGRHHEAIASYDQALKIRPAYVDALNNRGVALAKLHRHQDAVASYDNALAIEPHHAEALNNRGTSLQALNRHAEALEAFERLLAIAPEYKYALGYATHSRAHICDWEDFPSKIHTLVERVRAGKPVSAPFVFLAASDSAADQLSCATAYVREKYAPARSPLWKGERYQHGRIRLAYLSADLHDHATAYLMAELFERHDRDRFETIAISFGPGHRSEMRNRLVASFDQFVDVQGKSDVEAARLLREAEIDIAIDLKGFTQNSRPRILAQRPAPIQVNYLGYPGTLGAGYIDYLIADDFVIPRDQQIHYSEKLAYLPECYQVNDSKRKITEQTPTRVEARLPEQSFVFCSFGSSYKITPELFTVWMQLLKQVDQSVLWLLESNSAAENNLRREAQIRSVDPDRLIFAPRMKQEEHLARHRLADLFLDTLPCNAHTTASDALWAGLPVVTCVGKTFAGRVAGSLLRAIQLPELITDTLKAYEALALKLATDERLLHEIKEKLKKNRRSTPLFDTDRFCRHIESAYSTMWDIHQRGEEPRPFAVAPRAA